MKTPIAAPNYQGYRFPPQIISHCVWLSFRFSLSYRDIEELMAERAIMLTYAHGTAVVPDWLTNFRLLKKC